jgi:ATP-binding cassette subfamily G (WHITE) protein 2 (SNQ2)
MILALNPGGNTFYFGPVGENGSAVIKYFADRGVDCPPEKNVAEFILETAAKGGNRKDGKKLNWNTEWRNSEEAKAVKEEIQKLKSERSKVPAAEASTEHEFASPIWLQTTELTKRVFAQHWRDPPYLYGKLFASVIIGIFNGFTFWKLGYSIADMQDRMFTSFRKWLRDYSYLGVLRKTLLLRHAWRQKSGTHPIERLLTSMLCSNIVDPSNHRERCCAEILSE